MNSKYLNMIEVLINVFTVDKGILKILLFKKNTEPYKGYWMLPNSLLFNDETIEHCAIDIANNMIGVDDIYLQNSSVYSEVDRVPEKRVIGCSLIGILDNIKAEFQRHEVAGFESEWFSIDEIPKTVTDHGDIINDAISRLFDEIKKGPILRVIYPSDFTLPELQLVYEQVLNKKLDRRNFRKKILNMDIIEATGDKNDKQTGRPANLYRFKNDDHKDVIE